MNFLFCSKIELNFIQIGTFEANNGSLLKEKAIKYGKNSIWLNQKKKFNESLTLKLVIFPSPCQSIPKIHENLDKWFKIGNSIGFRRHLLVCASYVFFYLYVLECLLCFEVDLPLVLVIPCQYIKQFSELKRVVLYG